jgi:hypothetical protein
MLSPILEVESVPRDVENSPNLLGREATSKIYLKINFGAFTFLT